MKRQGKRSDDNWVLNPRSSANNVTTYCQDKVIKTEREGEGDPDEYSSLVSLPNGDQEVMGLAPTFHSGIQ